MNVLIVAMMVVAQFVSLFSGTPVEVSKNQQVDGVVSTGCFVSGRVYISTYLWGAWLAKGAKLQINAYAYHGELGVGVAVNSIEIRQSKQFLAAYLKVDPKQKTKVFWTVRAVKGSIFDEEIFFARSGMFDCYG